MHDHASHVHNGDASGIGKRGVVIDGDRSINVAGNGPCNIRRVLHRQRTSAKHCALHSETQVGGCAGGAREREWSGGIQCAVVETVNSKDGCGRRNVGFVKVTWSNTTSDEAKPKP